MPRLPREVIESLGGLTREVPVSSGTALEFIRSAVEAASGYEARKSGDGYIGRCPAHDDQVPSLSITDGGDKVLAYCHGPNCSFAEIRDALELTNPDFRTGQKTLRVPKRKLKRERYSYEEVCTWPTVATYHYNLGDKQLYRKRRLEPETQSGDKRVKTFRVDRFEGGKWLSGIDKRDDEGKPVPGRRVLYNQAEVRKAARDGRVVWFVEGEKDADRLSELGETATTTHDGAKGNWHSSYTRDLRKARVWIVADNDQAGREHARAVAAELGDVADEIRVLMSPLSQAGSDVSDHLNAGYTLDQLTELDETESTQLMGGGDFIFSAEEQIPAVWGKGDHVLWAEGEPLMIVGPTGAGKTTVGAQVILGLLGGPNEVLGYPTRTYQRGLYLAMDRPRQIARALARNFKALGQEWLNEHLEVWKGPPPSDVVKHPGLLLQMAQRANAEFIVIDSLKDLAGRLSDEETAFALQQAFQLCVTAGVQVLIYHHQRKSNGAPGQPKKPTDIDAVYGNMMLTAGMGSVLLVWAERAGDEMVILSHLKQPSESVWYEQVAQHHHATGTTTLAESDEGPIDPWSTFEGLAEAGDGVAASVLAKSLYPNVENPKTRNARADRLIQGWVKEGKAQECGFDRPGGRGGGGGGRRYRPVTEQSLPGVPRGTPRGSLAGGIPRGTPRTPR
jgi:5S rRNA maturation endonuclease (ribonuclease M5)